MRDAFPSPSRRQQTTQMLLEPSHLSLTHGPSRRLPSPALALKGATSYWASVVANPPGHMSRAGLQATGGSSRRVGPPSQATTSPDQALSEVQVQMVHLSRISWRADPGEDRQWAS